MAELDPARRAVITGLGALMPNGNDFPTYWANLQAGVTGTRTIQGFDSSDQEVHIAAEVIGYGSAADGWDMVQPIAAGVGSARAMQMALDRRGVPADEVDLINPHGTSTPLGDLRETEAIHTVFGQRSTGGAREVYISATKSMTGHLMGAAGAFEAFATVKSVAEQTAPGTINYRDPDPDCDLWVTPETVEMPIRYALSNNIGLGGHNGAIIFKRWDGS